MMRYFRRFIDPRNQYRRWIDPRVRTLRVADITAYLLRRNWKPMPPDRPGVLVFQEPPDLSTGEDSCYAFVPEVESGSDYPLRIFELLTGIAEVEDRQASEVIDDILRPSPVAEPNGAAKGETRESQARPDGTTAR